ncbi:MAG: tRNA threonylcarbamoyladenosine dehydratase, partial [Ruminococcaceae bacterium]|nr:tRNA threonylcarbamoyladenosine dehydratase [Oscillospiraceae bacterium]
SRTELLLGSEALAKLSQSRVAVFGVGGVGSFTVEGLVRSGVGKFLLVDDDLICLTNLNRQLHATRETIGRSKVEVMKERILSINPEAEVTVWQRFYQAPPLPGKTTEDDIEATETECPRPDADTECPKPDANADANAAAPQPDGPGHQVAWADVLAFHESIGGKIDYLVDAIDTVSAKIDLITNAQKAGIRVISCMGAGNKLDPTRLEIADIYATTMCPLARVMRRELRKRHVTALKVVYSCEEPCVHCTARTGTKRRSVPGSVSFVPSVAGLIIAGEVIKDLTGINSEPCC